MTDKTKANEAEEAGEKTQSSGNARVCAAERRVQTWRQKDNIMFE